MIELVIELFGCLFMRESALICTELYIFLIMMDPYGSMYIECVKRGILHYSKCAKNSSNPF